MGLLTNLHITICTVLFIYYVYKQDWSSFLLFVSSVIIIFYRNRYLKLLNEYEQLYSLNNIHVHNNNRIDATTIGQYIAEKIDPKSIE